MPSAYDYRERAKEIATIQTNKAAIIEHQWAQAVAYKQRKVLSAAQSRGITCACGITKPIEDTFRCYYCGVWYCEDCAPEHFGKPTH